MSAFYIIVLMLQIIAAIFGLATIMILCRQPASFYQKITTITAVCSFLGVVGYMCEILATDLGEALLAVRFGYIGKSYAMVLFLIFIARYCDFNMPRWIINLLLAYSTLNLLVVFSCPYHKLYYSSIEYIDNGLFSNLVLGRGPLYYFFMVITLLVMLLFMTICVSTLFKRKGEERRRLILLTLSGIFPALGLILNLFPFMQGFDPTPLGIFIATSLVIFNILRYGLLDTMQLASENAMDSTTGGIIVVSKSLNFVYANSTAYDIFPELRDDMQAKKLIPTLFGKAGDNNLDSQIINRNNIIYELNYSVLKENSQKSSGPYNNGYMAWVFDKTKDYNYTQELERLRRKAEESNRSKSIFLAKMSHEIRTPMNGIMGFADLALENNLDRETSEYVHYIKDSANSLLGIINDVLDISKIESGKMDIIDVEYNPVKFFDEIVNQFKTSAIEKGLEFNSYIPDDLPRILVGDSIRLREIIVNLLGNAIKYTKQGKVELIVDIFSREEERIVFEIKIRDTGIGIKKEKLATVFDIFEQSDSVGNYHVEGTGLGLSIAKELSLLMGGEIAVDSDYGVGSQFTIKIPQKYVNSKNAIDEMDYEDGKFALVTRDIRALLVDDNIINLKVEKGILERYGMKIDLCESGKECLIRTEKNRYDVIFMDHMMPDMDGVETMRAIRAGKSENVNAPILLVTANALVGVEQEMLNAGFDGFVSKPINIKLLEKELLRVLPAEKLEIVVPENEDAEEPGNMSASFLDELNKIGINVDVGMKYCGDTDTYKEILKIAVDGSKNKITTIETALAEEDYMGYRIITHSLKSGAANIGAVKLSEYAKNLEYAAKDNDIEYIRENTEEFLELYKKTMAVIKKNLEKEIETGADKEKMDQEDKVYFDWTDKLKSIEYLLSELEIDEAIEIAGELLKYNVDEESKMMLEEMLEHLDRFDVEGAKARLVSLYGADVS